MVARFEDLEAWQLADELKKKIYKLLRATEACRDRRFSEQLTDSAASAPANLSEGFGYYRHPEFARQTRTAKSSLMETKNHLLDGVDREYWTQSEAEPLLALADRTIGKCVKLLAHLETTDAPGTERSRPRKGQTTFATQPTTRHASNPQPSSAGAEFGDEIEETKTPRDRTDDH